VQGLPELVRKDTGKGKNPLSMSSMLMMNPLKTERMMLESMLKGQDPRSAMRESMDPDKNLSEDGKFWSALGSAFIQPYQKAIDEGKPMEAVGRGAFEVASLLVGGAEAKAGKVATESATVAKTVEKVTEVAQTSNKVTEVVQTANKVTEVAQAAERSVGVANADGTIARSLGQTDSTVGTSIRRTEPTRSMPPKVEPVKINKTNSGSKTKGRGYNRSEKSRQLGNESGKHDSQANKSSIDSKAGHNYAEDVLIGGTGKAFAGHGEFRYGTTPKAFVVPEGASISIWSKPDVRIPDRVGRLIETGNYDELAKLFRQNKEVREKLTGAATHLPGAGTKMDLPGDVKIPNYTLTAPTELVIHENSVTVEVPKTLGELVTPGSGHWDWAACTEFPRM
jgi:hypothetical protein